MNRPALEAAFRLAQQLPRRIHHERPRPEPEPAPRREAVAGDEVARRRAAVLEWRLREPPLPTREIAARLGISAPSVSDHIRALKAEGKLPLERRIGRV